MSKPLIEFGRDGKRLVVHADTNLPGDDGKGNCFFIFRWQCEDPAYAELLRRYFDDRLRDCVEDIRQEAYEQGRKDGRGKRKKATMFAESLVAGLRRGGCQ